MALLLPFAVDGRGPEDFSFSISLTRGERSRDSHSQTTRITLKGQELLYEKSYAGRGGSRSVPVRKSFRLRDEELEQLKKLVRDNELLTSDTLAAAEAESGVSRYFRIALNINLGGRKSSIEVSGPRNATEIKEKRAYQKANALLDAVYKILAERDKEIGYENRDLIIGSAQ
ncbi:MAG TPA: hypothetical protein VF717_11040 [Pyrinomonadaceae bacterium]